MVAICRRSSSRPSGRSFGRLVLALTAGSVAAACSAPPDGSDDGESGPPAFVGVGSSQPAAPGMSNAAPGAVPGNTSVGQNTEGNPSNVPITGAPSSGTATSNPASGGMNAGTAMGTGGAGGAMTGAAGNGSGPPQMMPPVGAAGNTQMPPAMPPPQMPPPQMPPVMEPPFVGGGCDGSAFFCEDFEDLALGTVQASAAFTPSTANGTLTIDGAVARGQRSLHVQTQGNGRAYIQLTNFAPPGNSYFARMYVQVQQFPSAPNYAHFTLVETAGQGAGLIRPIGGQFIQEENGVFWGPGSDAGPTGDWTNWRTTTPAEPGRFLCMEWEMNDADNNINIWIDSQAKPELSVSTNSHGGAQTPFQFPQLNNLWIGWQLYQGGPTPNQFNLWYDDIVFSTRRVGC